MLTVAGGGRGGVKFAKILLTSYVNTYYNCNFLTLSVSLYVINTLIDRLFELYYKM